MYGGISHKLSMLRKKETGSTDVVPNQFTFDTNDVSNPSTINPCYSNQNAIYVEGQITGINTSINLKLYVPGINNITIPFIYYRVGQTSNLSLWGSSASDIGSYIYEADTNSNGLYYSDKPMGFLEDGITFTVSNGDYVGFAAMINDGNIIGFSLINLSDNDTELDAINLVDCNF